MCPLATRIQSGAKCGSRHVSGEQGVGLHVPTGVWVGTIVLAFSAGVVNASGYLGFEHQALSHLTGTTSLGAVATGQGQWSLAGHLAGVVASYTGGALLAGLVLRSRTLSWGYAALLTLQTVLLLISAQALMHDHTWGGCFAAAACGLQNAMTTYASGSAIRSTHLTGFFTDVGLLLGQSTRGLQIPWRRLSLGCLVLGAFILGGVIAAWVFPHVGFAILLLPAGCSAALGAVLAAYLCLNTQMGSRHSQDDPSTKEPL
ncbi:YoaK family protein [Stenotrophomonas rhizophila]|uniref:YoaK family protein n=1 Tax=Stenotrophomonas rhizophila TaxID=216778 RepID=UPI003AF99F85